MNQPRPTSYDARRQRTGSGGPLGRDQSAEAASNDTDEFTPLTSPASPRHPQIHSLDPLLESPQDASAPKLSVSRVYREEGSARQLGIEQPNRLLLPFLVYCIAMGAVAVPKINVILALICVQYEGQDATAQKLGNDEICDSASAHARMGHFLMYANLISGIGSAISGPRIGRLSDWYGRKPLLAFSAIGLLFGDVLSITAAWFPHRVPVYVVLLEFAIGGLTGTFAATLAILQAYAADCTEGEARVSAFSKFHACMYIGQAAGPALGGYFTRHVGRGDLLSVFYAAGACHASFIVFVLFAVRESLSEAAREKMKVRIASRSFGSLSMREKCSAAINACNIFRPLKILRPQLEMSSQVARRNLPLLASIDGVVFGTQLGLASVLILYPEFIFGWKTTKASFFLSITNATRAIILTVVMPIICRFASGKGFRFSASRSLNFKEEISATTVGFSVRTVQVALLMQLLGLVGFALAGNSIMYTISGILAAAAAPASPTAQSLMTSYVDAGRVGELLGAVGLLHALARCVIPAVIQFVYSMTIGHAPGALFWVLSALFAGALALSSCIRR